MSLLMLFLFCLVIILPVIAWSWFFAYQDHVEPEPRRLLNKILIIGVGIGILIGAIESLFFKIFFPGANELINQNLTQSQISLADMIAILFFVCLAGLIEEYFKFVFLKMSVYTKIAFNQVAYGVIYGATLALGFATIENVSYFIVLAQTQTTAEFIITTTIRAIVTLLMHLTATGIVGYYLGMAKFSSANRGLILTKGVLIAFLLHGCFNVMVSIPWFNLVAIAMVIVAFAWLIKKMKSRNAQIVWRLVWPKKENIQITHQSK